MSDPAGDVRLIHPQHPAIGSGTFDLSSFELLETETHIIAKAEFVSPVRIIHNIRLSEDRRASVYPQTVDIYIDSSPEVGDVKTLPDREVYVPANEAWDQVLVMSSIRELHTPGTVYASHLIVRGRTFIGAFPKADINLPIRGALVLVAATSARGDGRIRKASTFKGVCTDWNQDRCTLLGSGPPILDSTSTIDAKQPVPLRYLDGQTRPPAVTYPVVFRRGRLIGVAPVSHDRIKPGMIATVFDKEGQAIATAVVLNLVEDTVSLEVVGDSEVQSAETVAFQETNR